MELQRKLHNINLKVTIECSHNLMRVGSQSVRPSTSSRIAVTSCHDYLLTSSAPDSGCTYVYIIIHPEFWAKHYIESAFVLHFPKQQEDLVMMLASTQET
jgi:hypothetical protein